MGLRVRVGGRAVAGTVIRIQLFDRTDVLVVGIRLIDGRKLLVGVRRRLGVTISSSAPAFELDNIAWKTASSDCYIGNNCTFTPPSGLTPAPETSSLLLFCATAAGLVGAARRRRKQS